jgi:hypothetical protein
MLRRLAALAGAAAASLAFAASASAATAPVLNPIPAYVCSSSITASWTPSTPNAGASIVAYRVDIGDLTAGTATYKWVGGLSTSVGPLVNGHQYVVRVRALESYRGTYSYSPSSGRTFKRLCLEIPPEKLKDYVAYNPFPECIMCGRIDFEIDDPVIQRTLATATLPTDQLKGIALEADGSVIF